MSSTHTPGEESPDDDDIFPSIVDATTDRGQHIFCKNLLLNLFEPGISPCKTEFPDVKIKRQIIDHYLKDICNLTQQYGIYSIEFNSPNQNHSKYVIQTDDLDLEFSKVFSEYIKSIQYHNSQRANSIFTNEVFAIIYSYISILENEIPITNVSPTETSKHIRVRHEITLLSSFLNIIKENFTKDEVSQHTKHDLQKILAWFIIDYFTHNIDLISQARKNFRPQNSNDDTAITEQSDYVWDPEWSHPAFINFPQSISSQAISTISYVRDYVRVIPLTIDATPLNYNTFLPDMQNNSLNSTVIHNENLNGTRNLTQQDIQTPSHFINEEIVHTTTTQQSISPIRPNLTTPRNTNPSQTQVTLQSTVKPSVAPKYSHMDYQTYRPMTIPSKTRKTFTRNNFAEHNYNYTHPSKTNYPPRKNFNNYTRSRNWDNPMAQTNSVNFQTNLHPSQDRSENYPFFQQNKNKKQTSYQMDYLSSDDDFLQPDIFAPYNQEYRGQGVQKPHTNHRIFSPQPIDTQNQQPIQQQNPINTQYFQPIQQQNPMITHSYQPTQMQNEIPLPYYLQQHEITRNQLSNFSQMPNAAESLQMTMNPYLMGGSSITSNKPLMVFTGTDPEYSVEDYLNAVTANLILNIGPEPINTPLHQNWIHRRTALIQTTLDGAAQKWFSVLPIEIKSNWKRFTQEFSKMFDSERNKQQQRVLCNEIRRLPNETIKQLAVRIETLVRKAYSLNTHDYKNTKMTEILMMTLTPQLRKMGVIFSPQPIDTQNQQPIQQQNPINTQYFQPIQQQNPMITHSYQPTQMQNEIPLPYYLQQHEITRNQLSNFSQMPNAAESLQMTMNPYLMGGSSITSNKPLMVFTGTDPEYSVEDYLNAVTANLILNIGPEPINTPLHQNWIHRRTALIQTTLDGAAQKWFSVLPIEIKSNWKRFTQEFSKMFDSERNKQQQRVLCNEIRRLPNETIKQLAVRIETLVRKAYSLNTHDYKNTKMTEILMMTLTPQLRKIAIKKRASHPSSIREPDLDFRKLVDKLEQAEITMKLEETENLKLQYVNRIETNTTSINNIQESDTDLVEKITEILNIYEKHPNFKGKPSFKKWCNYCRRYGHSISECRQKQQDNQNKPQKYKEPNKSFYQYMKKDQNLPNKTVYSNNSSGKPLPNNTNYTRNQSPYNSSYRGRSPERRNTQNSSQNHYNRPNSRNNYSRSNSNTTRFVSRSNSQSRNNYYPNNQSRNSSYNRNRNYSNNRNRSYSNNRNQNYPNNRSRNNSYNRSNYNRPNNNYQNRSRNNSQNRHSSYNNRYRNYSQSPHTNNNHYNNSNNRHRSSTPKHQRNINQVQSNPETTSDPPGIDDTVNDMLQLNQINCESSDSESETENTISINMIAVENDYEPIIYEQPFSSHIYENQSELLHNYYIEPIHSTPTTQKTNEINTTNQPNENDKTKCLNTNHIYQNIQKEQPKEKIWTIPFLLESPRSKEFQPPDLEIDFLIDSGAESNIINIPTWNEIKTLHPKLTPLETSSKLATAQGSTLVNYGKIQLFLLPTRTMEQNKILTKPFKQIFHITDIKHNIIGIPFISKYIPTINILNSKILIKDKYTKAKDTSLTFFQRLNKQPPFFSKFYPIYNQQRKHLKPLSGNIYNFSIKQVHQYDKKQNKQQLYMSDFEFKPIHKFFKITISSIKYLKNSNSDIISLHVYNNTPYQVTLPLGLLGYCETNATISPIYEKAYRVNNILQLLDICQSTILNEELSINNIISNEKRNTDYFTKTPYFKPTFNINNYTENQQKFLTMFNFQHSQITQDEFEKLAKQLIKYSSVYATSKFDVGKISSSLHLPLKPDAVFKKQRASKVPIHLHDKVNRLLDILEQYNIISPVNKEEQPKGNTFINPVIILAKGESLKIVLDARYLNSLIDESKCNWPIEPIQVILTKINGKYFTTADMNSAYNQMPLDEQSRRLTQFVIGNQQYEFIRLLYGISIGPAAFSAFMSKIFRPLILKKNAITYLDDVFMQSQTKEEMFNVLEQYHLILQNENLKAAPDKSHFFLTRVKFLGHNIERKTITPLKSRIDANQKLQPPTNKKKIQEFLGI